MRQYQEAKEKYEYLTGSIVFLIHQIELSIEIPAVLYFALLGSFVVEEVVGGVTSQWRLMIVASPLSLAAAHPKFSKFESIVQYNDNRLRQQFLDSSTHPLDLASCTENNSRRNSCCSDAKKKLKSASASKTTTTLKSHHINHGAINNPTPSHAQHPLDLQTTQSKRCIFALHLGPRQSRAVGPASASRVHPASKCTNPPNPISN